MPHMGWILGLLRHGEHSACPDSPASGASSRPSSRRTIPSCRSACGVVLDGTLWTFRTFMVIAAIGTVLAAGYLLWMLQKVAFGKPKQEFADAHVHDVSPYEWTAWLPILLLILALGIFPNLIFSVTDDAVTCQTAAPFVSPTTVTDTPPVRCPVIPVSPVDVQTAAQVSGG